MKVLNSLYDAGRRSAAAIILFILAVPILSSAQQQSFKIISDHSTASLFLGTRENPTSFNVGVARVSGEVQVAAGDIGASRFSFTIYAANQTPLASHNQNLYGDQPVISFRSETVEQRSDGSLKVRGPLTVTQVFYETSASTGEDYSGLEYSSPALFRTSHEATFIFGGLKQTASASGSGDARALAVQLNQPGSGTPLTATVSINGEAFPELSSSIQDVAWPVLVDDEDCVMPLTAGEDYSGPRCTGTVHELSPSPVLLVQPGEDYAGIQQVPPAGDQVTIQLNLKLGSPDANSADNQGRPDSTGKAKAASLQQAGSQ